MGKSFEQSLTQAEFVYTDKQPATVNIDKTNNMLNEVLGKVSSSINKFANKVNQSHQRMQDGDTLGAAAAMMSKDKPNQPEQDPNSIFAGSGTQQGIYPQQTQAKQPQTNLNTSQQTRQPRGDQTQQWQQYLQPTWNKMPPDMRKQFGDNLDAFVRYKMQEANFRKQGHKI